MMRIVRGPIRRRKRKKWIFYGKMCRFLRSVIRERSKVKGKMKKKRGVKRIHLQNGCLW